MSRVVTGLVVLIVLLGTSACGDTSGSAGATLSPHLDAVDAAAVTEDPEQLTSAVGNLVRAVDDAEAAGVVSADHADRIRAAAEALLEASVPADRRSPRRTPESTSPPPDEDAGEDGDDDDDDGSGEDDESRSERGGPPDKAKHKDKGHDKDD